MTYQHDTNQINQLADKLENPEIDTYKGLGWKAAFHLRELQGRIAELESMLDAVGAGGVGQSIKPPVQADTAPAAWAIYSDDGTAIRLWSRDKKSAQEAADKFGLPLVALYTAPQPTENLHCKSTQKRLATLWGYEKARQPLTDERILSIVRAAPALDTVEAEFLHIARAVEVAHGIIGGQQ